MKDITYGLWTAFHTLAYQLHPRWKIVDRGCGGRCENNSLAIAAGVAGFVQCTGAELRRALCNHAQELLMADYAWAPSDANTEALTLKRMSIRGQDPR